MSYLFLIHCYSKGLGREEEGKRSRKQLVDFHTFKPISSTLLGIYVCMKNSKVKHVSYGAWPPSAPSSP